MSENAFSFKELIIDASILFSFFKKDSIRRQIFEELLNEGCKLVSPNFVLEELRSDKHKIINFSKISEGDFEFSFATLEDEIELVQESEYGELFAEAKKLSPHNKDVPYFATALKLNYPIWSDEKAFKQQSKVKVFSTEDLLKILSHIS